MEFPRATKSSTETTSTSSSWSAKMLNTTASLDFGEATWVKQHHSSSSADSQADIVGSFNNPDGEDPEAMETQKTNAQFADTIRRLLPTSQQRHRQLDVARLNRSLASISRGSYQQRNSCPYDATSRCWVDLTVRIKREDPAKMLRDFEALQRLRRKRRGVKKPSSRGDDANSIDVWTRQFRMRADPSRRFHEALRPLLDRLGYSDRRYSVTVNGFAQAPEEVTKASGGGKGKKHQVEEAGLLFTIGSLAERGVSEIFVNFDFDLC